MKKIFSTLAIAAVMIAFGFYAVVYSRWFPGLALKAWIRIQHPGVELKTLSFSQRKVEPDRISFEDLSCQLKETTSNISLRATSLDLHFEKNFWSDLKNLNIALKNGEFSRENLTLKDLNGTLEIKNSPGKKPPALSGQWSGSSIAFGNYQIHHVALQVGGDLQDLQLNDISSEGYGGQITGEILFHFLSVLSYDVHLKLKSLDSKELQSISEAVFSQFEGRVTGHLNIQGHGNTVDDFKSEVHLDDKGQIRAKLLSPFTQYIPETLQKSELSDLIEKDASLPVDKVHLRLKNVGQDKLSFNVDLDSSVIRLEGSTLDINLDAPIARVLQLIQIFSKDR